MLLSISSTMNLKALALSTTRVVSASVSMVCVVSVFLVYADTEITGSFIILTESPNADISPE